MSVHARRHRERGAVGRWLAGGRFGAGRVAEVRVDGARLSTAAHALGGGLRRSAVRLVGVHRGDGGADRGSATVWSVGAVAVLCVVFGAVLALGQAVVVRHRAAGGADLAALAAADHWADGPEVACARAEDVARDQGVRLVRCVLVGEVSDVTAASGRGPFTAEIRARAGPAGPVPSAAPLAPALDGAAQTPSGARGPVPPQDPAVPADHGAGPRGVPPAEPPATAR